MLSTPGRDRDNGWLVKRSVLLGVFLVSFVVAFLFTSAAFQQTSVSETAAELLRAPEMILAPGLEGNTASQLLAVYNAAAIVAAVAYAAGRKSNDGYGAVMVGLSAFTTGVALIFALGEWRSGSTVTDWAAWALSAVGAILAVRWWYLAGQATSPGATVPAGPVGKVGYLLAAILMAAGPSVLLTEQFVAAMKTLLPDILLFGGPVLLVAYLLGEGLIMRTKLARSGV